MTVFLFHLFSSCLLPSNNKVNIKEIDSTSAESLSSNVDDIAITDDSIDISMCKIILSYTPEQAKKVLEAVKICLDKKANPNCLYTTTRSERKLVSYIPIVKHFVSDKYNEYDVVSTPLNYAIPSLDTALVGLLIKYGANANTPDPANNFPLDIALRSDSRKMIDFLLNHEADPTKANLSNTKSFALTCFFLDKGASCKTVNIKEFQNSIEYLKKLKTYAKDWNIFEFDARNLIDHPVIAKYLIEDGLSVNAVCAWPDDCPLICSIIQYSVDDDLLNFVLNKKVNLKVNCKFGEDLLTLAVKQNKLKIAEKLMEKGLSPNFETLGGSTPLYAAVQQNNGDIIRLLIAHGGKKETTSYFSQTPLYTAVRYNCYNSVFVLLELGANIQVKSSGKSLLHEAIEQNNFAITKLLIDKGIDLNAQYENKNYLSYAKENNASTEIIQLLD